MAKKIRIAKLSQPPETWARKRKMKMKIPTFASGKPDPNLFQVGICAAAVLFPSPSSENGRLVVTVTTGDCAITLALIASGQP